jgi:transposase
MKRSIEIQGIEYKEQTGPGRPSANTPYWIRKENSVSSHWQLNAQALQDETATDGVFLLLTNDRDISVKNALVAYKHHHRSRKRQQLKSVLQVRPVMRQNHLRIESLLFVYFLALLTEALIEHETRNRASSSSSR